MLDGELFTPSNDKGSDHLCNRGLSCFVNSFYTIRVTNILHYDLLPTLRSYKHGSEEQWTGNLSTYAEGRHLRPVIYSREDCQVEDIVLHGGS